MENPIPITSTCLEDTEIRHGFFTREGGISDGIYRGLNVGLGSEDNRKNVEENRRRVASFFAVDESRLLSCYQIHSPDVLIADGPWTLPERPKADALVCKTAGMAIGILTADCGPVLFSDKHNKIVGAAHAGWKGATGGVLENTVDSMISLGAKRENIIAVLGPTISQNNYEVGPEFVDNLLKLSPSNDVWLKASRNENHAMFDLPGYIVDRLGDYGVSAQWTGHCTYADEKKFYSYRRTTHRREPDYGRQISSICVM